MRRFFTRYWRSDQGLAAVEFAFVLPIILTMLLGMVELSQALGLRAEIINMASTGGDLIAQESTAKGTDMDGVFNALNSMLYPHDVGPASITVSSVIDGGVGKAPKVAWSCTEGRHPALETKGSAPSTAVPAGLITAGGGGSIIWSRVTYDYTSSLSYFLVGMMSWKNDFYLKPRRVLQIPFSGTPATAGAQCTS